MSDFFLCHTRTLCQVEMYSSRYDQIPLELINEVVIECPQDYMKFIPPELEEPFTSAEFAKAAHIPVKLAQTTLNLLFYMDVVERVGKKGNSYLYLPVDK